ncbi:anthranilate phosphoribosyltransferase [Catalinimonas alkaloidigena]|uniref:Anthranilate phosphoribosyltransferase n=1 Tax=Catalinimonas alkaloidigena TaxID=1075417 RepID=A0A1G9IXQ9_9BACT|nr:anthranilate phosphoribosyltransferase [Catalinimonas alkaloidigena]SDL29865.1 anthranilate phosphoribosyltransferase [Catalinimonas alkaloidigena]
MKDTLNRLLSYQTLSSDEARTILKELTSGQVNQSQMAAFITVYMMRSITVEELAGFRDAMLDLCLPVDFSDHSTIDVCGTGGDGKDTFNISTLSAFVVAGTGQKVAKHGNTGVSSVCGSSNVMQHFGYQFTNDVSVLRQQLEEVGLCFLHAPLFHPAMKNVAPIRRELGIKTFFNMLGPMVNPVQPQNQMVGVFSLELGRLYAYLYQQTGKNFAIVHSLDGYDEISLTGPFKLITHQSERVVRPEELGLPQLDPAELHGGDTVESAAGIFLNVLEGKGTEAQTAAVCANAGLALHCVDPALSLKLAVEQARDTLESGKAREVFEQLMKLSREKVTS